MNDDDPVRKPAIFWHSDPVQPGEVVMLAGHGLRDASVEVMPLIDDADALPEARLAAAGCAWSRVRPVSADDQAMTFELPRYLVPGAFLCRVLSGSATSGTVTLNAPAPWWVQGDAGRMASRGGELRVFGKCLDIGQRARAQLRRPHGALALDLPVLERSGYALRAHVPDTIAAGAYDVWTHNGTGGCRGWRSGGSIDIIEAPIAREAVMVVTDFGAQPNTGRDCTLAIVQALERLAGLGGGVLYFPRGRYRIDAGLRSGMWIAHALRIPRNVVLRGEGMGLVSLYWPDRQEPLPSLIEGGDDFSVEDLTLYTQGRHRNVISGGSRVRIRRVRIRANCYFGLDAAGKEHRGRNVTERQDEMGAAIELAGDDVEVSDCDILHSAAGVVLKHVRGATIVRNAIRYGRAWGLIYGGERILVEDNRCEGGHLACTGGTIGLFFGASAARHTYVGGNGFSHIYGGDRETLTLDGHGTAYVGSIVQASGMRLELAGLPRFGTTDRDGLSDWRGRYLYVISGCGAGQLREIMDIEGRILTLASSWQTDPDATSVVKIGNYNGRHLFVGNDVTDAGYPIQFYPPNCECIAAENRARRTASFVAAGMLGFDRIGGNKRAEPSWYSQFLDNRVDEGNGWGGGEEFRYDLNPACGEAALHLKGEQMTYALDHAKNEIAQPIGRGELAEMLGVDESALADLAISRWHVVRRHAISSNSSVRISGSIRDVVVEDCVIADSDRGIRIEADALSARTDEDPGFGCPRRIWLHRNRFERVTLPIDASGAGPVDPPEGISTDRADADSAASHDAAAGHAASHSVVG